MTTVIGRPFCVVFLFADPQEPLPLPKGKGKGKVRHLRYNGIILKIRCVPHIPSQCPKSDQFPSVLGMLDHSFDDEVIARLVSDNVVSFVLRELAWDPVDGLVSRIRDASQDELFVKAERPAKAKAKPAPHAGVDWLHRGGRDNCEAHHRFHKLWKQQTTYHNPKNQSNYLCL
jgi:hypothetical protein